MTTGELLPLAFTHLDACASIFVAAFSEQPCNQPWTHDAARERLKEILDSPKALGLVYARPDGEALGFALGFARQRADGRTFVLDELCVAPEARRRGVATRLLSCLHDNLAGMGVDRVLVETFADTPAEAFYRKGGYNEASGKTMVKRLRVRREGEPLDRTRKLPGASVEVKPIGHVRTDAEKVPTSFRDSEVEGKLEIHEPYRDALTGIEPGQRIVVIFHFHESPAFSERHLRQTPPHLRETNRSVGVFGICSPVRPNPIGMSVVEVLDVHGTTLRVKGLDMRDGTPILDIKPFLPPVPTR